MGRERLTFSATGSTPVNGVAAHNTSIIIPSVHSNVKFSMFLHVSSLSGDVVRGSTTVFEQSPIISFFYQNFKGT